MTKRTRVMRGLLTLAAAGVVGSGAALATASPAYAWAAATGSRGGAAAVTPRGGAVATGPRGGAAAVGPRGGAAAVGPRGGAAAVGPRGGAVATGPAGGAAVARPGYPGYRPPVAVAPVPVYPGYGRPAPVAGAVAVGAVAGATVGAVAAASRPYPNTVVVAGPTPTAWAVGQTVTVLPAGCAVAAVGGATYYQCGPAWVRPYMQGAAVTYVVVAPP